MRSMSFGVGLVVTKLPSTRRLRTIGDEASAWLSRFLETTCALVYMPEEGWRTVEVDPNGTGVSFADAFPFPVSETKALKCSS